jgi:hypothetical protein
MTDYISCLVNICELGCLLATSCIEAMVHESFSSDTFNFSITLLSKIEALFDIKSEVLEIMLMYY